MPGKTTVSIICLTIIVIVAMLNDINGAILAPAILSIGGLGGYALVKSKTTKG